MEHFANVIPQNESLCVWGLPAAQTKPKLPRWTNLWGLRVSLLSRTHLAPPRASNPEKLITCHVSSELRRTLMRSSWKSCSAPGRRMGRRVLVLARWAHWAILILLLSARTPAGGTLERFSFSPQQQSAGQCNYSLPSLCPKQSDTDALCAVRDSVHPLPSYHQPDSVRGGASIFLFKNKASLPLETLHF